jgi:phage terminase large subunit-like protein
VTRSAALDLVPPTFHWMPEYGQTLGPEVAELAELVGFPPDPEQRLALDMLFAMGPAGKVAIRDFGICAPRQNLKTGLLKQAALGWLFITEQRLVVWSAHEFSTAQEAFRDMCILLEDAPDLEREIKQVHRANGEEAIELVGDRRLKFKARTKAGGRGLTGDKIVLDEAMYLRSTHMGALVPTLRAVPDPQLVLAGSAGMVDSGVWRGYRDRGRQGGDRSLGWLEYCDPEPGGCLREGCDHHVGIEGCALDDRDRWWATNTALGRRITEDTLASDRLTLIESPLEFARETLGWWEDPLEGGGILDLELWAALRRRVGTPDRPTLSVEVAPDRSMTTLGAAWRVNGRPYVELIEERPDVEWAAERLAELVRKYRTGPVVLDGGSEAAQLLPALERAGVPVLKLNGAERAAACGGFYDLASTAALSHSGDPALASAIAAARWKDIGEGARVFSRRKSAGDIRALYAVTFALYGLQAQPTYDVLDSFF